MHFDVFFVVFIQFSFICKLSFLTGVLGVEEDTQPLAEEQPKESTSKKRKGEKQVQDNTKKKKRKKTVKVLTGDCEAIQIFPVRIVIVGFQK